MVGRPRNFDAESVLDRAMGVFWSKGYEATGIADLEQATGLGRQSLYGAFGDKRALFTRVVDRYFETVLKPGIIEVLDAPGSGRANVERLLDQWEAVASAPDFRGCLVGNGVTQLPAHDAEMAQLLDRKLRLLEAAFVRALSRARTAGEIPEQVDVKALARSLLSLSQGLAVVARVRQSRSLVRDVVGQARRLLG